LPTILSRCQRFDFRRIPVPEIVERLREVCEAEGVEADEESLMLLARKGNGALRDALSAFDQALSLCGSTLEYGELTRALGVVDQDLFFKLTDHVATQNTAGMLKLVRHVVRSGYDLQEVLVGLAEHLRNLLVAHSLGGDALEEVAESTRKRYAEEAERFEEADLLRLLTMAGDAEDDIKQSPQPRLKLETVLLKMAQLRRSADLREVLEKIDRLEQMAEEGELPETVPDDGAATGDASSSSPASADPETSDTTAEDAGQDPPDAGAEPVPDYVSESEVVPTPSEESSAEQKRPGETFEEEEPASTSAAPEADETPEAEGEEAPAVEDAATDDENESEEWESDDRPDPGGGEKAKSDPSVEYNDLFGTPALESDDSDTEERADTDATGDPASGDDPGAENEGRTQAATVAEPTVASAPGDGVAAEWPRVVQAVKKEYVSLGALLGETEPVECAGGTLTVAVPRDLHRDTLRDRKRDLLRHVAATVERSIEDIRFVVDTTNDDGAAGSSTSDEPLSPREQLQRLRDTYPALNVLFTDFGAESVW
ncbi:MAG: DNA polymerase III subunit gamma/tau, partial [Salinibacter sp.]